MIPDWCKRAAEEVQMHYGDEGIPLAYAVEQSAAIIAKYAPRKQYLGEQVRELVEAARGLHCIDHDDKEVIVSIDEYNRLRRALEPFHE